MLWPANVLQLCTEVSSRVEQGLTVVESVGCVTKEHSSDCQQAADGDAEAVKLPQGNSPNGKQKDHSLQDSPASIETKDLSLEG